MLFNSYEYIFLFLPASVLIYFLLNSLRYSKLPTIFLVTASLFFYGWWNPIYLPLIVGSVIFNYLIGKYIRKINSTNPRSASISLIIGILGNLALLGFFKYTDFFITNYNVLSESNISLLHLALPLAISFFTFQQIAYIVDCKKHEVTDRGFLSYAAFVSFFPQLIAGPIVHNKEMMPQFLDRSNSHINFNNIAAGMFIFSIGLFKKVVIADTFAVWANLGFNTNASLELIEAWTVSLSYAFQLYFDFSGYTDMALGSALMFNIKLPINFNSPYKATNIQDFWRRWHITLSRFLKDYIYVPLGGNRRGEFRTQTNLMAVFVLGGLWHGAGWTFVFWGTLHGIGLCVHRMWSKAGFKLWRWFAWLVTFAYVLIAWVFFRATSFNDAVSILKGMIGMNGVTLPQSVVSNLSFLRILGANSGNTFINLHGQSHSLIWIALGFIVVLFFKNSIELKDNIKFNNFTLVGTVIMFVAATLMLNRVSEFLYFNF